MSHFTRVKTQIRDLECLLEALRLMGFKTVETGAAIALKGYHGDDRSKLSTNDPNYAPLCQVAIRRQYIGSASNDIGFFLAEDGTYELFISEYDKKRIPHFEEQLKQLYAMGVVIKYSKLKGYQAVGQQKLEDGSIRLVMRKW